MKIAKWGLIVALAAPAGIAAAQQQQQPQQVNAESAQPEDSLAAAARRAREQKKQQPKTVKVWNNDNVPKSSDGVSVIGPAPAASESENAANAPAGGQAAAAAPAGATKPSDTEASKKAAETDIAAAKDQLQSLQTDLDIMRRKLLLDQQSYQSNPNYASDTAGAANLKDEQDQIDAKQQELSDAQKKIGDLQAKLNALGAASGSTPDQPKSSN